MKVLRLCSVSMLWLLWFGCLLVPLTVFGQSAASEKSDVTYRGPMGELVQGRRCATPVPGAAEQMYIRKQVQEWLSEKNYRNNAMAATTIPVAFHVVRYDDGITADVSEVQIADQMQVLNDAFSNSNFQFELASTDYADNTQWSTHQYGSRHERQMKRRLAIDPETTLNFYTCVLGGNLLGYATFPWMYAENSYMHGVVVRYSTLPGGSAAPYDMGDTGVHEVGHYVGLYHTFQGGCTPPGV